MDHTSLLTRGRAPVPGPSSATPAPLVRRCAALGLAVVVVAVLTAALWWRSEGGRWFVVETPSMGTAMPVGTLVLTSPADVDDIGPGDVVTFRAPHSGTVYTHRVVERVASPATGGEPHLVTKGDVNDAPDAGSIGQEHLVGEVVRHAPALGWALKAVPVLVVGGAVTWLLSLLLARRRRRAARLVGASLTLSFANWLLHPWVGLEKVSQRVPEDGSRGVLLDVISVGLLPVRAEQLGGGASVSLGDGQLETLHLAGRDDGAYAVTAALDLAWWGWALLVVVCLVPMAVSLLLGQEHDGSPT